MASVYEIGGTNGLMDVVWIHPLKNPDLLPRRGTPTLRGPIFLVQWLVVGLAALVWVVFVPLIELVREIFRPASAPLSLDPRGLPR